MSGWGGELMAGRIGQEKEGQEREKKRGELANRERAVIEGNFSTTTQVLQSSLRMVRFGSVIYT